MARFTDGFLDQIRARVSLHGLVGKYVKLTKRGKDYLGLCPFHSEKTPSFTVNEDKGFYHCFGCQAHGDVIRFMMERERMPFPEAVEKLAAIAGLEMPRDEYRAKREDKAKPSWHDILAAATGFFQEQLSDMQGADGLGYLKRRGLSPETIAKFRLGYAPSGNHIARAFPAKGFTMDDLRALGLVKARDDRPDELYDAFRDRVMFPIFNAKNQPIAFGGRVLGNAEPKYLNSPDSAIFHKSHVLYAHNFAIGHMRQTGRALAVEGYMDVMQLHQAGINYAVAPLGTAMTQQQMALMFRSVDTPTLCFDGDSAGTNAAIRAGLRVLPLLKPGKSLRFMFLPKGLDPDDFIRQFGAFEFEQLFQKAESLDEVLWRMLYNQNSIDTPEQQAKFMQAIETVFKDVADSDIRGLYITDFKRRLKDNIFSQRKSRLGAEAKGGRRRFSIIQGEDTGKTSLAYLLAFPEYMVDYIEDYFSKLYINHQRIDAELTGVIDALMENPGHTSATLQEAFPDTVAYVKGFIKKVEKQDGAQIRENIQVLMKDLRVKELEAEIRPLLQRMAKLELDEQGARYLNSLQAEFKRLKSDEE
ncbi:MAG: DNA primase [Alphaproteobacteria bacterium]|nr:DNA primase [Alphaproteobacteria bacterium]